MYWIILALFVSATGAATIEAAPNGKVFYGRAECEEMLDFVTEFNYANPKKPVFWCQQVIAPTGENT